MTTYKILVIDDAFFIRNLIKKAVNRKPIKNDINFEIVGEAENGNEGLTLVKELQPDIITVDFNIPELNGLDFAKYLKETNPKIPILMISSNTDPNFPKEVEDIGCHFLQKPFQESFLWMRLDSLVGEIENFDESKIKPTVSQETKELLDEISMEVEAEIDETPIEIEEISLPKVNTNTKPKQKKKKKKKNSNNLFGLEIDDSIVIKPKNENSITNTNDESDKSFDNDNKIDLNIKKDDLKENKSIELEVSKKIDSSKENKSNSLTTENEEIESKKDTIEEDDEDSIIIEDEEPIIIDDEDDNVIVIDDNEEIIIEDDSNEEDEEDNNEEIILEDEFNNENNDENDIIINSTEEQFETERDKQIKLLKESVSYSYQNEMAYVLHVMEKLAASSKKESSISDIINEPIEEQEKPNNLGLETTVIREEDLSKEEEDEEFDRLFAEFNPTLDLSYIENIEEKKEEKHKEVKEKLLQQAPSITQQIEIEPPKSNKVRQIYKKDSPEPDELILPIEDKPKKVSIFTRIFNFFSRK